MFQPIWKSSNPLLFLQMVRMVNLILIHLLIVFLFTDSLDSMLGGKTQPDPKDDSLKTEEEDSPMCVRTPRMKHQVFASKHKNGGYVTR